MAPKKTKEKEPAKEAQRTFGMASAFRYSSATSMLDFLFNVMLVITVLFVLSFLLINPKKKRKVITIPTDLIVTMTWPDSTAEIEADDVDLFIQGPGGVVSFKTREVPGMNLDRDDVGNYGDVIVREDGGTSRNLRNWEHVSIRTLVEGTYYINSLMWTKRTAQPTPVSIKVERIEPYELIFDGTRILNFMDDETFVTLHVDNRKRVRIDTKTKKKLRPDRR